MTKLNFLKTRYISFDSQSMAGQWERANILSLFCLSLINEAENLRYFIEFFLTDLLEFSVKYGSHGIKEYQLAILEKDALFFFLEYKFVLTQSYYFLLKNALRFVDTHGVTLRDIFLVNNAFQEVLVSLFFLKQKFKVDIVFKKINAYCYNNSKCVGVLLKFKINKKEVFL